jgi:hypothetical protein
MTVTFKGPPKYALYGTTTTNVTARIAGRETLAEIEDLKWVHAKSYPGTTYRVFECTWKEVK